MISAIKNTLHPQTISIQTDLTRRARLSAASFIAFFEFRLACLRAATLTAVWKKHYEYMEIDSLRPRQPLRPPVLRPFQIVAKFPLFMLATGLGVS